MKLRARGGKAEGAVKQRVPQRVQDSWEWEAAGLQLAGGMQSWLRVRLGGNASIYTLQ